MKVVPISCLLTMLKPLIRKVSSRGLLQALWNLRKGSLTALFGSEYELWPEAGCRVSGGRELGRAVALQPPSLPHLASHHTQEDSSTHMRGWEECSQQQRWPWPTSALCPSPSPRPWSTRYPAPSSPCSSSSSSSWASPTATASVLGNSSRIMRGNRRLWWSHFLPAISRESQLESLLYW